MEIKQLKDQTENLDFLTSTQPMGNMRFHDTMFQVGNTFVASLYVWRYPNEPVGFWQAFMHNIPNSYVITDLADQESLDVIKKLQRSIREQYSRVIQEKEAFDREIALEEYHELTSLAKSIRRSQEVIKYMTTRIILFADSRYELEKRISETKKLLEKEQFAGTPLAMEQEYEYQSLFLNHTAQSKLANKRVGLDIPAEYVRYTFPANHVFLHDPRGQHVGYSLTGGNIILDLFELDNLYRKHYNTMIIGDMGSGKSTLMKKMIYNMSAKGYVLRGFDKSGEYTELIHYLGGKIIALDGTMGKLNIFQVFPTVIDPITNQIDEIASFTQHKSKLGTWYSILKPEADPEEIDLFELSLNQLYELHRFDSSNPLENYTGRNNTEYPILEDLVELVKTLHLSPNSTDLERLTYERIYITLKKLNDSYGKIFNGYTTFDNLQTEQLLFFNIDGLMALNNKPIEDAQMFNALSLFWATLLNHGKEQMKLYKKRKITFDEIKRSMLIIDEAHNQVNKDTPRQTKFVNTMQREGRKYFVGVMLATQSVNSLAPEIMTHDAAELLRDVYNFSQYKIFFKMSSAQIPHLKRLTQYDITDGHAERIARYPVGRCLMNITGGNSIEFDVDVSDRELELFNGGGRNTEDQ